MSSKERDQLQAEFSILSSLTSTHIVQYYHREHIKQTQELYMYMEYCGGGDLGTIIRELKKTNKTAKEDFVWRVFSQILAALYRCHYGVDPPPPGDSSRPPRSPLEAGRTNPMILHRDLKPENIFLDGEKSVKLGDFGLSKVMQSHDFASTYVGTPFYMSPEICASERYTLKSDIWALGCIIYELCAKDPPFNAQTHLQLINKIRKGEVAPLPQEYSKELNAIVKSCLVTNPVYRPDTESLLNHPLVWTARKQQGFATIAKALTCEKEILWEKLRKAEEKIAAMEADNLTLKGDLEAQIRREWEVKARLEIDRQVELEYQKRVTELQAQFNQEVSRRVRDQTSRHVCSVESNTASEGTAASTSNFFKDKYNHQSSTTTVAEDSEWTNTTDLTELSDLSIHSPQQKSAKLPSKRAKTPFSRSKTTFESPADVHMAEPSPMSISSLALSPRRQNNYTQVLSGKNLFAQMAENKARLTIAEDSSENKENELPESDDEDFPDLPSPTRPRSKQTDPFKMPPLPQPSSGLRSKLRPGLTRQHTVATTSKLTTKPNLFPATNVSSSTVQVVRALGTTTALNLPLPAPRIPRSATDNDLQQIKPTSPVQPDRRRRLSKIPSRGDLATDNSTHERQVIAIGSTSPIRRAATTSAITHTTRLQPKTNPLITKLEGQPQLSTIEPNVVAGRTRVELAQARAGGRSMGEHSRPGIGGIRLVEKDLPAVPVWDPEEVGDDAMPSPFLKREIRVIRGLR